MLRTAFLLVSLVVISSCSIKVTDFSFRTNGSKVTLLAPHGTPKEMQASFLASKGNGADGPSRRSPRYTLSGAASAGKADAFYLDYTTVGSGPLSLHLYEKNSSTGKAIEASTPLPSKVSTGDVLKAGADVSSHPAAIRYRFLVPVAEYTKITGFQVTGGSPTAEIRILGSGLTKDFPGVELGKGRLTIREGLQLTTPASDRSSIGLSFADLIAHLATKQAQIVLTYTFSGGNGDVHLVAAGTSKESQRYYLFLRKGTHHLYLYTASVGFTPRSLRITSANPGFKLDAVAVHPFSPPPASSGSFGATTPIPADFGAMIDYRPSYWRQAGYELFSWSLVPSVLVMQFASYAVQARYMKRFAFFIEKYGYTGKLWTNEQLAKLHGWNAHDYRPEDLARFYTEAAKEKFTLNPEELHLRQILIGNGLIVPDGTEYKPGSGAILTFAHVGPYWLRRLLLTHEGYHGVFFTHPAYRQAVFSIWKHTPPPEQELFRNIFLYWAHYNIDDPYLVQNEFQAYLMQQPIASVQGYFDNELSYEMKRMQYPADSPLLSYLTSNTQPFHASALAVQKAVEEAVGVAAGELVGLSPEG